MAEKTVLDLVQDILNTLDSDPVNSISDTIESDQVAKLLRRTYYDIVEEYGLPSNKSLVNLEGVSELARPNLLKLPRNVQRLLEWSYNKDKVHFLSQEAFLTMVNQRNALNTTDFTVVYYAPTVSLTIDHRADPTYWTSFDDEYIVTDSWSAEEDTTLQASKTQAWVEWEPTFELRDDFIPRLPENLGQLLYRTAEGEAYALYKQTLNPKLEQKEARLRIRAQRNKYRTQEDENNTFFRAPNYGRK